MPTWGNWDYDSLACRTRRPRNDNRTRQEAREYFTLNPSGELRFEQSAGDRYYSQYRLRDTVTDVDTARAAGVPIVLVGFGPEGEGVARLKPDVLLPHYRDLGTVIEELIGRVE